MLILRRIAGLRPKAVLNACGWIVAGMGMLCNAVNANTTVIDILVVYSKSAEDLYLGDPTTRINHLFQVTNQIYKDSELDIEIRLLKTMMVDYTDENSGKDALRDITYAQNVVFKDVENMRTQVNADMVIFYRPFTNTHGSCGQAWTVGEGSNGDFSHPNYKDYMYSHIPLNSCADYVTAHELGHNMGLRHSRRQDGAGAAFPSAVGYGVDNLFTTIMAYQSAFNVDYWEGKVYKFSSPNLSCRGQPCGIDQSNPNGADARYAISLTAPQIANYFSAISSSVVCSISNTEIASSTSRSTISEHTANTSSSSLTYVNNTGGSGCVSDFLLILMGLCFAHRYQYLRNNKNKVGIDY